MPVEINNIFTLNLGYSQKSQNKRCQNKLFYLKSMIAKLVKSVVPDKLSLVELSSFPELRLDNYDVIISSSDPKGIHIATSRFISKHKGIFKGKYIQYWGDPWFDDISRSTNYLTKLAESKLLKFSDHVIYNSSRTLDRQKKIHPKSSQKMSYLPRGLFSENSNYVVDIPVMANNSKKIVYAGDYRSRYRNIIPLLDAIESSDFSLNIYGDGELPKKEYKKTTFYSRVSQEELNQKTSDASIQIVLMNDKGGQVPGKLFDLMLSNHHVLVILDGDFTSSDIPCKERFFICNNNKEAIRNELIKINSVSSKMIIDLRDYDIKKLVNNMFNSVVEDK
ncbi:hypothetical protein AK965_18060 [Vibrio sp. PID17_43]|nr:hypothetical protein AK965_18060 [Vibrio sp. PID17_43]